MNTQLLYRIGITLIPGIGVINAKNLIAHCGSAEAVFKEKKQTLLRVPGAGDKIVSQIIDQRILSRAEEEIVFMEKEQIKALYYLDDDYPARLKLCEDSPIILYQKGQTKSNNYHIIAFVGSRAATDYGREFCNNFIKEIKDFNPLIVSGLAYGIDISSHKAALEYRIPTIGVLGHGLDRVYPSLHTNTARKMIENGGALISEFLSGSAPDRENFPKRNRIIAGMCEAIIVVQAAIKGGALITAEIANSYNRDVFAVPGRLNDTYSEGCNFLIKTNKASLLSTPADLKYILGWENEKIKNSTQRSLFIELSEEEDVIRKALQQAEKVELDQLCYNLQQPVSKVLPLLMTMELKGLVKSFPGKVFSFLN